MGVLASGLGRRSSSHYSPTDSPNSPSLLVKRQFAFPILAVLAVAALGLWLLLPGGALRAQDAAIEYPEKGTGAVATYTAVDPEMTDIVRWSLSGTDAGKFEIDGGVLTFEKSPDFEKPGDVVGTGTSTAAAGDNVYEVTVQATDETGKTGKKEVKVTVTNVEEPGKVTLSAVQPQSDVELTADHSDPDLRVTDLKWQWAKSSSQNGSYTDIEDAISDTYTPEDGDVGSYLRVTASYTDGEDSGKSAMAVSAYAVQGVRGGNRAPVFPDQDSDMTGDQSTVATREVAENTKAGQAIGNPVVAEDKDDDILTYTLVDPDPNVDTDDEDSFTIDWATGQLKTKGKLNYDVEDERTYTVTVRATDPAGKPLALATTADDMNSSDSIEVTINVTNVNEGPAVTGQTDEATNDGADLTFNEVVATDNLETGGTSGVIATALNDYTADDPETITPPTFSVTGADAGSSRSAMTAYSPLRILRLLVPTTRRLGTRTRTMCTR